MEVEIGGRRALCRHGGGDHSEAPLLRDDRGQRRQQQRTQLLARGVMRRAAGLMGAQAQGQGPGARLRQRAAARRRCGLCHRPDRRGRCAAALLSEPILKALRIGDIQPRQQLFPRDRRSWHDPPGPDPDALPGDLQATRMRLQGFAEVAEFLPQAGLPLSSAARRPKSVREPCALPFHAGRQQKHGKQAPCAPARDGQRVAVGGQQAKGAVQGELQGRVPGRAGLGLATGGLRRAGIAAPLAQGFSAEVGPVTRVEKGRGRPDTRMIFRRLRSGRRWGEHDGNSTGRARS